MRRWNGWGESSVDYPLPPKGPEFLQKHVGAGHPPKDSSLESIVAAVPQSRLAYNSLINEDPARRVFHARGQSLPDWIALRSGRIRSFPDGVAYPATNDEIAELIKFAQQTNTKLIPYGGGTSVVGHINPPSGDSPILTVNMRHMNQLHRFDEKSLLATFGAGISGPELEARLRAIGCTLGHFPQSFELSTLGGWIATRSSGQQSLGYGRIEDLYAGGRVITPAGRLDLLPHPASAAGPDLRQIILGSEGRLGFISQATMRVALLPEKEEFHALFFPEFEQGMAAVRQMMQHQIPISMLRLSTAVETETTLALAGHERIITLLEQFLAIRGVSAEKVMLLIGFTGNERIVNAARKSAFSIARHYKGVHVGRQFGKQWHKGRFKTPYLRNTLWELGYAVDTLETAVPWDSILPTMVAIESAINSGLEDSSERVHAFTHLSHMYGQGASIYTTYIFRLSPDPDETLFRWRQMKSAASRAIIEHRGTISHQHGVGYDHAPYLPAEKGEIGMDLLNNIVVNIDPQGVMNPGKLIKPGTKLSR
ncbi:MAG: FAD-binding oxidoreductase [Candidatus Promineifilaceae bacterium]|nr:FAD-binding oxidoreductase [Candidatus Promineifilaceae bacterium]